MSRQKREQVMFDLVLETPWNQCVHLEHDTFTVVFAWCARNPASCISSLVVMGAG